MKKWIVIVSALLLSACSTTKLVEQERQVVVEDSELVHAFIIDGRNLYIIGEKNDYQVKGGDVEILGRIVSSKVAQKAKVIEKEITLHIMRDNVVYANYRIALDASHLTPAQMKHLEGVDLKLLDQKFVRSLQATGVVTRFENREQYIAKAQKLAKPIPVKLGILTTQKEMVKRKEASLLTKVLVWPITVPVAAVGMTVYAGTVWGAVGLSGAAK